MDIYATDTSSWTDWMHEYFWGAFYIFPPSPIMEEVNALRTRYDPESAAGCKAHLSLSDTIPERITEHHLAELRGKLETFEPFEIKYGPVSTHPPYPGVTFAINPKDKFFALRELIHSTSLFEKSPLTRKAYPPHMTIVEFGVDMEQSEALKEQLQAQLAPQISSGSWLCESIWLATPTNNMCMIARMEFPLGRDSTAQA